MKRLYPAQLTIDDFNLGNHVCCIYEIERDPWAFLTVFVQQGLERVEKVLYIVDVPDAATVSENLRAEGMDPEPFLTTGQLVLRTHDDIHSPRGKLDPETMIGALKAETEHALAGSFTGLRIINDMSWVRLGAPDVEYMIAFEARLNRFVLAHPCLALCRYDLKHFDPTTLSGVLCTHPAVVIDQELHNNVFYMTPTMTPTGSYATDFPTAQQHSWIQHLIEFKRKEKALRRNEERFRKVFEEGPIGMMMVDLQQRILRANPTLCQMLGYSEDVLKTMTVAAMDCSPSALAP